MVAIAAPRRKAGASLGVLAFSVMKTAALLVLAACASLPAFAASIEPDLARLATDGVGWEIVSRPGFAAQADADERPVAVQSSPTAIAYVRGLELAEGTIEFTLRGRAGDGSSFVGVAFHGVDGTTYDGVYFRPFNFGHANDVKRRHAVQYIAHPDWPWFRLRRERTDEFEKGITPEPAPDAWFTARIVRFS